MKFMVFLFNSFELSVNSQFKKNLYLCSEITLNSKIIIIKLYNNGKSKSIICKSRNLSFCKRK